MTIKDYFLEAGFKAADVFQDMVKFGGSGKSKQSCKDRKCDKMIDCKVRSTKPVKKVTSKSGGRRSLPKKIKKMSDSDEGIKKSSSEEEVEEEKPRRGVRKKSVSKKSPKQARKRSDSEEETEEESEEEESEDETVRRKSSGRRGVKRVQRLSFSAVLSTALNAHLDTHLRKEGQSGGARLQEQACHLCGKRFPRDRIGQHLLKSHPDGRVPVGPPAASAPNTGDTVMTCHLCDREFRHVNGKRTSFFFGAKGRTVADIIILCTVPVPD